MPASRLKCSLWRSPEARSWTCGAPFTTTGSVQTVILEDDPVAGVRLYCLLDDVLRNTVVGLDGAPSIRSVSAPFARPPSAFPPPSTGLYSTPPLFRRPWVGCPSQLSSEGAAHARSRRRSAPWAEELPALPAAHVPLRRDRLHVAAAGKLARAFATNWSAKLCIPVLTSDSVEKWCVAPTSRSAAPPHLPS